MKTTVFWLLLIPFILAGCHSPSNDVISDETGDVLSVDDLLAPAQAEDFFNQQNLLEVVKGSATILSDTGFEDGVSAGATVEVVIGDTIVISDDGEAILTWFDDSISRLAASTEITISEADFNPEDLSETHITFSVLTGIVWSKVVSLVNPDSEFTGESGDIVAGVRGSAFNMVVVDDQLWVESSEHSSFVAGIDRDDGEYLNEQTIVEGRQVFIKDRKRSLTQAGLVLGDIPDHKKISRWYEWNEGEDIDAIERISKKNIDRLRARVGALPGEPGYEAKQEAIEAKLALASDLATRVELEARIEQLHATEAMVLLLEGKTSDADIRDQIDQAKNTIDQADIPQEKKDRLLYQLQGDLQIIDRSLVDITPEKTELYNVKEILREKVIELELDAEERAALENSLIQTRIYEHYDYQQSSDFDPAKYETYLENHADAYEILRQRAETNPELEHYLKMISADGIATDEELRILKDESIKSEDTVTDKPVISDSLIDLTLYDRVFYIVRELKAAGVEPLPEVIHRLESEVELQKRFLNLSREEKIRVLEHGF